MNKIFNGYNSHMLDVCFNHPDDSSFNTYVCFIADDNTDDISDLEFDKIMCEEIWKKFNYGNYYHEMIISCKHVVDDKAYTTHKRYDGYDVESLPTDIQDIR